MTWNPLDATPQVFHVGLIVEDLDGAVAQYSAALGYQFAERREIRVPLFLDGTRRTAEVTATYSLDGPPHLELIAMQSGRISDAAAVGLHNHVGVWSPDVPGAMTRLEQAGMPGRVHDRRSPTQVSYHQTASGVWIELVDLSMRQMIDDWIATSFG
jgi:methylmalonyl-CoA/ethylmalonyl-CoA epimerase